MNMQNLSQTPAIDQLRPLLLNIGLALHHGDWNWKNVSSPFARIYYVTEGTAQIHIGDMTYILQPDHLYMIPAFVCHSYSCSSVFKHYYIHIYEDILPAGSWLDKYEFPVELESNPLDLLLVQRLHQLNPYMQLPQSDPKSYNDKLSVQESVKRNKQRSLSNRIESRGILFQLISRFMLNAHAKPLAKDNRIEKALKLINSNLSEPLSIDYIASETCLSKDHLIRLFKKETGEPPLHYINRRKIESAQLMLITDSMPVKSIAYALGYDDNSYFIRLFKKYTGMSPLEYRHRMR